MPRKFASLFAPACFAFLLFAAAGSASAQATNCDPDTDPNQCVVGSSDPDPGNGPHAKMGGSLSGAAGDPGGLTSAYAALPTSQPNDDFYTILLMLSGLA